MDAIERLIKEQKYEEALGQIPQAMQAIQAGRAAQSAGVKQHGNMQMVVHQLKMHLVNLLCKCHRDEEAIQPLKECILFARRNVSAESTIPIFTLALANLHKKLAGIYFSISEWAHALSNYTISLDMLQTISVLEGLRKSLDPELLCQCARMYKEICITINSCRLRQISACDEMWGPCELIAQTIPACLVIVTPEVLASLEAPRAKLQRHNHTVIQIRESLRELLPLMADREDIVLLHEMTDLFIILNSLDDARACLATQARIAAAHSLDKNDKSNMYMLMSQANVLIHSKQSRSALSLLKRAQKIAVDARLTTFYIYRILQTQFAVAYHKIHQSARACFIMKTVVEDTAATLGPKHPRSISTTRIYNVLCGGGVPPPRPLLMGNQYGGEAPGQSCTGYSFGNPYDDESLNDDNGGLFID